MLRFASVLLLASIYLLGATHGVEVRAEAIRLLIGQARINEALAKLAILAEQGKKDPEAALAAGEIFQEMAELRANRLQEVAPESAAAHELLGQSLESRGKLEEALAEYQRALDKEPNTPGLHFLIGNVDWKLRNLEAAQNEFTKELRVNPHHGMANLRMGEIALNRERDQPLRAVAFLQEAAADAKSSLEAHRELGKALRVAHQFPAAVKELQLVEVQNPGDESVHAQLAALYRDMGDKEGARREIEMHARILSQKLEASQKAHAQQIR